MLKTGREKEEQQLKPKEQDMMDMGRKLRQG